MVKCDYTVVDKNTGTKRRCKNESDDHCCWLHNKSQNGGARRTSQKTSSKGRRLTSTDMARIEKEEKIR